MGCRACRSRHGHDSPHSRRLFQFHGIRNVRVHFPGGMAGICCAVAARRNCGAGAVCIPLRRIFDMLLACIQCRIPRDLSLCTCRDVSDVRVCRVRTAFFSRHSEVTPEFLHSRFVAAGSTATRRTAPESRPGLAGGASVSARRNPGQRIPISRMALDESFARATRWLDSLDRRLARSSFAGGRGGSQSRQEPSRHPVAGRSKIRFFLHPADPKGLKRNGRIHGTSSPIELASDLPPRYQGALDFCNRRHETGAYLCHQKERNFRATC